MPELPEVEAGRRTVEGEALERSVETVSVTPDGMTVTVSERTLRTALRGHRLTAARRHGKHLFVGSGEERGRWLRLHFGMTGEVRVLGPGRDGGGSGSAEGGGSGDSDGAGEPDPRHVRLRLELAGDRALIFRCPRKLGEIGLVESPERFVEEKGLGPDVLASDFGLRGFRRVLESRSSTIKSALMNQKVLAGVGNEYSDEALFQAGFHPATPVTSLDDDAVGHLWRTLRRVLQTAVEARSGGRSLPSGWLMGHRTEGDECPRCEGTIEKDRIAGRSSYFCPDHQHREVG